MFLLAIWQFFIIQWFNICPHLNIFTKNTKTPPLLLHIDSNFNGRNLVHRVNSTCRHILMCLRGACMYACCNALRILFWNQKMIRPNKVLSLLETCFDLFLGSSLHMKIQIMGWKITENLGFKSPLRKVKKNLFFFLFIFKYFTQKWISFILTTFWYLV